MESAFWHLLSDVLNQIVETKCSTFSHDLLLIFFKYKVTAKFILGIDFDHLCSLHVSALLPSQTALQITEHCTQSHFKVSIMEKPNAANLSMIFFF